MGRITGGTISYGETRKIAEYESKRADVVLSFSVDEGEDPRIIMQDCEDKAMLRVFAMFSRKPGDFSVGHNSTPKETAAIAMNVADDKPKRPRKVRLADAIPEVTELADPAAVEEMVSDVLAKPSMTEAVKDAAAVEEDDDLLTGSAPDITDAEVVTAITKRNSVIKNAPAIKALVGKYVKPGQKSHDIPQSLRPKFLADLATLPAAG